MSDYYASYLTVACFGGLGLALFGAMLAMARVVQPRRQTATKLMTYECGVDPVGDGWSQQNVRYYIFALLFVIFDVEAVFIFPWATVMGGLGVAGLVEMLVFVAILAVSLLYAIRKGVLQWL